MTSLLVTLFFDRRTASEHEVGAAGGHFTGPSCHVSSATRFVRESFLKELGCCEVKQPLFSLMAQSKSHHSRNDRLYACLPERAPLVMDIYYRLVRRPPITWSEVNERCSPLSAHALMRGEFSVFSTICQGHHPGSGEIGSQIFGVCGGAVLGAQGQVLQLLDALAVAGLVPVGHG